MHRFKNILLVCGQHSTHEDLIERAIRLAKANEAHLTLVDVVDTEPGELAKLFASLSATQSREMESEIMELRHASLAELSAPIKSEGISTTEVVLQGISFVEIIRKVLRDGHDFLMKEAAGKSEGKSLFFASTDLHLLRKCPRPVWVMKHDSHRRYAKIMAAVDPDPRDDRRDDLNVLVMDLATSLSEREGSELLVANAWMLSEENSMRHSAFARVPKAEIDRMVEERRKQSRQRLDELMLRYPSNVEARRIYHLKGEARQVVPEFAEKNRVDLIVMGTVGRTGVRGLIIGNTAEATLNQVRCSVLAVKPPGFETPVRL